MKGLGTTRWGRGRRSLVPHSYAMALALLLSVVPGEALAFRSSGDLSEFGDQPRVIFANPQIQVELFEEIPPALEPDAVEDTITRAAATWSAPGCTTLDMSYAGTTDAAAEAGDDRNTIQWVSDWKDRGFPADSPGVTDVQYSKGSAGKWTIAEADLYLNQAFDWTTGVPTEDKKSLVAILTHELGHVLGLLHPCEIDGADGAPDCSESTSYEATEMYPIYSPDQTALANDDIEGVCFLYSLVCDDTSCDEGEACHAGTCEPLCGDQVCSVGTQCDNNRCVPTSTDCGVEGCVGQACDKDSDCATREYCRGGTCAHGEGAPGDPCTSAQQCFDGACFDGVCAQSCHLEEACSSGGQCDPDALACTDARSPMGEACDFATDCRGGYCLEQAGKTPVCSRSCVEGQPSCPSGWGCRKVDDTSVCAPRPPTDESCSTTPPSHPFTATHALLLGALSLAFSRAARRRTLRRSTT